MDYTQPFSLYLTPEAEQHLDVLLDRYPDRSIGWVIRRAIAQLVEAREEA